MDFLLVKQDKGYGEYPIDEAVEIEGERYRAKEMKPFSWTKVNEKIICLYQKGKPTAYERVHEFTIDGADGDIRIKNFPYAVYITGNTGIIVKKEKDCKQDIYINGKQICFQQAEVQLTFREGDFLLLNTVKLTFFRNEILVWANKEDIRVSLLLVSPDKQFYEGFPKYKRSPRLIKNVPVKGFDISRPPEKSHIQKSSLIQVIVSPLVMLAVTIAVSILLKRGIYIVMSGATTVMTLIFSIVKYINDKKDCKEKDRKRFAIYESYLLRKRKEISKAKKQEEEALAYHYPSVEAIAHMIGGYSSRIYERTMQDDDFLTVSVGSVRETVSFPISFDYNELSLEADELELEARQIKEQFSYIEHKPVVIDLKKAHLGLVGEKDLIHEQLKLLVAQLTFFQSYHDLQIITLYDEKYEDAFAWMKWYAHTKIKAFNVTGCIHSERLRDQVLGSLHQVLKDRKLKRDESKKESRFSPHFLFIIDEPKLIMDHSIMEYLDKEGDELGFSIIYTTHLRANLPEYIGTVVELQDSKEGTLLLNEKHMVDKRMQLAHVGNVDLEWMARDLGVLEHTQSITSQIPETITFFDMYNIKKPEQLKVEERWRKNEAHKSLGVPVGARAKDDYVYLNLHEKAHGPHGLVAGTTGSGKSEMIQSYILSLAVQFHPYQVGFLLIDYKGGGMAGLFKNLPHLLGTITNLDGSESMRAMASIKSELARRQRIFSEYNVNHINGYHKLYNSGVVKEPIPHLFLISDEFAELKKEQPEFMTELISAARIGRSLGIHLILATQKPSGVVDDQIWTNAKFKVALKVQDEADSREILRTTDAASITQVGRAYLQVGNNEIYELFQSAFSGAAYEEAGEETKGDNRVYLVNDLGQGVLLNEDLSEVGESNQLKATQLDVVIQYLQKTFQAQRLEPVKRPWLPSLAYVITSPCAEILKETGWKEMKEMPSHQTLDLKVAVGMADMPEEQSQQPYELDFVKDGNVSYFASPGFGKTTFLTTVIMSLAIKNPVEALQFYILDFGSSGLIPMSGLPHTADYMQIDDIEKISKFTKLLLEEMKERKRILAEKMVQNFEVYNQMAETPLKAVIVVVDNFDGVKELGLDFEEFFSKISRDGMGLGIYLLISATRSNSVRNNTLTNFKIKIAGYLFEENESYSLVGRSIYKVPEQRGRALVNFRNVNIMQIYTMADTKDEIQYNQSLKMMIQDIAAKYPGRRAPKIPILPEQFTYSMIKDYEKAQDAGDILLGLQKESVLLTGFHREESVFAIVGEGAKGKTNALKIILKQVIGTGKVYLFDGKGMNLYGFKGAENVVYIETLEAFDDFIDDLEDLCQTRKAAFKERLEQEGGLQKNKFFHELEPVYILIDDLETFIEPREEQEKELTELLKEAAGCGVTILVAIHAGKPLPNNGFVRWIKTTTNGLLLSGQGTLNIFPVTLTREYPQFGDGLLFHNGTYERIMLPRCEDEDRNI